MSTLTIALASLGGVVLAGVIAHGAWQARRAGPKRATPRLREEPSADAPRPPTAQAGDDDDAGARPVGDDAVLAGGACRGACRCSSTR